ncbi:unnamed protein product [Phytophthora fragariaefolia]|uniref:Unnamed protein product n=1 Tax=Phytophthora fragariaefolia TaxID=1490495 RepID=A0A9W7DBX2_9STRA|nr:unnamed protein product [Phytophthora fragariaefolia]
MASSLVLIIPVAILVGVVLPIRAFEQSGTSEWPALRFHFKLKRSSMEVYGQSDFEMIANPIVSGDQDSVLYDVFATFKDGSKVYNYTLVDGIAYSSSWSSDTSSISPAVSGLDSDAAKLPSINSIVAALEDVVPVSGAGSAPIDCPSESLFKLTVNGIDLVLCAADSSGFTLFGGDMDATVQFMNNHLDIIAPRTDMHQCAEVASPSAITSIGKSILTGKPIPNDTRRLRAAFDFPFKGSLCSCKSKPRPYIFIHGMGVEEEMPENQDDFTDYWGDHLVEHAPCCSTMTFAHLNTVNNAWTSTIQQQNVSNRALAVTDYSNEDVITDTIVVTHSMGKLMFAGALATGKCSLDASSTWVGLAGPMMGSMASDFVQESCAGETNIVWDKIGNITGRCPPSTALKSLAYQNGSHTTEEMNAAYAAAQEAYRDNIHALMCSTSFSGITSRYQPKFWALGAMVPHKSHNNDGMVEFESCSVGFSKDRFGGSWRDRFYETKLNHYDMKFLNGDAILNDEKMPLKWFECLL